MIARQYKGVLECSLPHIDPHAVQLVLAPPPLLALATAVGAPFEGACNQACNRARLSARAVPTKVPTTRPEHSRVP